MCVELPDPVTEGEISLERAIAARRSVRDYSPASLTLAETSRLLWAALGFTSRDGYRAYPSAGALYPLEGVLAAGKVEGLTPGVYRYRPRNHRLRKLRDGDRRAELCAAALNQGAVAGASAVFVLSGVIRRTAGKYGPRAERYVFMEAGHAAQNLLLEAVSLGLSSVPVGAFRDDRVRAVLGLDADEDPLYLLPVGRPR
jgi:SagB-type dehydrogenase family enzyme